MAKAGKTIVVRTGGGAKGKYEVRIGAGIVARCADGIVNKGGSALVVVDHHLPRVMVEPLLRGLDRAGVRWAVKVIAATEGDKSLLTLSDTLAEAGKLRLERSDAVIALGGGIVTDVAGLAAALHRRGVRVVQCPTTLLAMVDAAVGGKTGVNIEVPGEDGKERLVKNAVGAFHQPARVVCDVEALRSLPARELRCGMAECIKHGVLGGGAGDRGLLAWTEKNLEKALRLEGKVLLELIGRNVAIKAKVVMGDEREESTKADGGRMMLNLGHTFAHAIETLPGLAWLEGGKTVVGPLKHGEAVGLGLLCATRLAAGLKMCEKELPLRVEALLVRAGLPTVIEGLPAGVAVVERMKDDKKVSGGKVRLVLPVKGGRVRVRDNVNPAKIAAVVETIRTK